ncbi:T9SS type A sorting domain-containing protein [bacterium AH-315-B15]|nr:T9SS type A sorting domain-containing protein [bacterium AH-315-B15]
MKRLFTLLALSLSMSAFSQVCLNGSFEIASSSGCFYGLTNAAFISSTPNVTAWGTASQIDKMNGSCGFGTAQDGTTFLGLAVDITDTDYDAIAVGLDVPLSPGTSYDVTFYMRKDPAYASNDVELGHSDDGLSIGTIISTFSAPTSTTTWESYTITFTAATAANYITLRTVPGTYGWNFVDHFSIIAGPSCVPTSSSTSVTECFSYTVPSGDETYSSSGVVMDTIPNAAGCDSVMTIDVTINTVDAGISLSGVTLSADASGATYQWLICPAMTPIAGETSQNYSPTADGDYAVIVTENGCVDTSDCMNVHGVGVKEFDNGFGIKVYPNPSRGEFVISLGSELENVEVDIINVAGKVVWSKRYAKIQTIPIDLQVADGIYFIQLSSNNKSSTTKLIKQ